jgi:hypothetical protein
VELTARYLAVLQRRALYLARRIETQPAPQQPLSWDQLELDALLWALPILGHAPRPGDSILHAGDGERDGNTVMSRRPPAPPPARRDTGHR